MNQLHDITPERRKMAASHIAALENLAGRYERDADLRARIEAGDTADSIAELGMTIPAGVEAKIVANTPGTFYFVLPPDPNVALQDEALTAIGGGKTAGTVGSAGSASSLVSCASTVGSVGSMGCAG